MTLPVRHLHKSNPWQLQLRERRVLLFLGDALMGIIALGISLFVWGSRLRFIEFDLAFLQERVPFWFYLLPLVWIILLVELYDVHRAVDWRRTVNGIATAALIGFGLYLVIYFYYTGSGNNLPRVSIAVFLVTVAILTFLWRSLYIRIFTAPQFMRRVLLVGGGKAGGTLLRVINDLKPSPFYLVGIVDDDMEKTGTEIEGFTVLGTSDSLLKLIEKHVVSDIVVAISGEMQSGMFQALLDAQESGIDIVRMPKIYEDLLGRVPIRLLEADWILRSFVDESRVSGFFTISKRLVDIIVGLLGILLFLLMAPILSLVIFIDDGRPIFYTQTRSGRGGQPYALIKFRTMSRDAEADGVPKWAKEDDERATRVGRVLRKTHLDEIPQFVNVLRGEMSLVGPRAERPELMALFEKHVPFYRARLLVKPGITGWAQINFGYASNVEETTIKLEYDLYYIKNRNIMMDLVILLRTPATGFRLRGR
jgi:exopolysaccharide biosynthesis polyprenyl glycosylphosphotransferase